MKLKSHPIHSRSLKVKYFDLTKRCEDGSVASSSSCAILSWRGKQQFYHPNIVVLGLSYSRVKQQTNNFIIQRCEKTPWGRPHRWQWFAATPCWSSQSSAPGPPRPPGQSWSYLDHKSWCLVGFGQVLIEEVITQELTFGLLWSDHDKLALKVEYTREGQVLCPLTVLFDDATNQVHNLVWIGYYPLQSLIFKGYEAKIERSPLTSL